MGSVIFIIIVIVAIVSALNKTKAQQKKPQGDGSYGDANGSSGRRTSGGTSYQSSSGNTAYQKSTSSSVKDSYSYGQSASARTGGSAGSSMKSRANASSTSASTGSYATKKAAERARDNMSDKELKGRPSAQEFRDMAGVEAGDGAILSAAKMHSFATELGNEFDSQEDLMKPVYDLMITGPDTSLPNGRDFLSEATDMLNSYVTET